MNAYYAPPPPRSDPAYVPQQQKPKTVGVIALCVSLIAAIVGPLAAGFFSFWMVEHIGTQIGKAELDAGDLIAAGWAGSNLYGWADRVFWFATALGMWGFVQGIVAIASNRGRWPGVGAVVVSIFGPLLYFAAAWIGIQIGFFSLA